MTTIHKYPLIVDQHHLYDQKDLGKLSTKTFYKPIIDTLRREKVLSQDEIVKTVWKQFKPATPLEKALLLSNSDRALGNYIVQAINELKAAGIITGQENAKNMSQLYCLSPKANTKVIDLPKMKTDSLNEYFANLKNNLAKQLLDMLLKIDPRQLEHISTELLTKMGYAGPNGKTVTTQYRKDGGIDGLLVKDALGFDTMAVQVKRFARNHHISKDMLETFRKTLNDKSIKKGVYVTTSSFTPQAEKYALQSNIRLIDGQHLVKYMIKYKVGIEPRKTFIIYSLSNETNN